MGDRVIVLNGRPSRIEQDIAIDLAAAAQPRHARAAALFGIARAGLEHAFDRRTAGGIDYGPGKG